MQLKAKVVLSAISALFVFTSVLCAQTAGQPATSSGQPLAREGQPAIGGNYIVSQKLIGAEVWGRQGENLGQVGRL